MEQQLEIYHAALRGAQRIASALPDAIDPAEGAAEAWIKLTRKGEHKPNVAYRAGQNEARELGRIWMRRRDCTDAMRDRVLVASITSTGREDAIEALALLPRKIRDALEHTRADYRFHARKLALAYFMERTDVRL